MEKNPKLSTLAYVGFTINSAIENGHLNEITFIEVHQAIQQGTIVDFLEARLGQDVDLSMISGQGAKDEGAAFAKAMQYVQPAFEGRERRKTGVKSCGLCLLMAYILEAMQHGVWES